MEFLIVFMVLISSTTIVGILLFTIKQSQTQKTPHEGFLKQYRGKLVCFSERGNIDTFHHWILRHEKDLIQLVGVENYIIEAIAVSILSALLDQGLAHPIGFSEDKGGDNKALLFIGNQEEFKQYKTQENNRLEQLLSQKNNRLELFKKLTML